MVDETEVILADPDMMRAIRKGEEDIREGRVHDHADVFAELDAEFAGEEPT
jgi:predicted transcriptional regulator